MSCKTQFKKEIMRFIHLAPLNPSQRDQNFHSQDFIRDVKPTATCSCQSIFSLQISNKPDFLEKYSRLEHEKLLKKLFSLQSLVPTLKTLIINYWAKDITVDTNSFANLHKMGIKKVRTKFVLIGAYICNIACSSLPILVMNQWLLLMNPIIVDEFRQTVQLYQLYIDILNTRRTRIYIKAHQSVQCYKTQNHTENNSSRMTLSVKKIMHCMKNEEN